MKNTEPKRQKPEPDRLKLDVDWKDAAGRLLDAPAASTPKRTLKPRKAAAPPEPGWPFPKKGEPGRLRIDMHWEDAAKRLLEPAPDPTPTRKSRKKRAN